MRTALIAALLALSLSGFAQSLSQSLIASGGGSTSVLDWSIGETVITSVESSNNVLTQGFQQPSIVITGIEASAEIFSDFKVYPNPTRSIIYVQQEQGNFSPMRIEIFDLSGALVRVETMYMGMASIDVQSLASGMYLLQITVSDISTKTYRVVKQN